MSFADIKGWPEGKTSFRDLTREERDLICELNPPEATFLHSAEFRFDWSWVACGFGQISVYYDRETKSIEIMNECMSRDSIRKMLHSLADFIADRAILSDNLEDVPPVDLAAEIDRHLREEEEYRLRKEAARRAKLQKQEEINEANRQGSNFP